MLERLNTRSFIDPPPPSERSVLISEKWTRRPPRRSNNVRVMDRTFPNVLKSRDLVSLGDVDSSTSIVG